MNAAQRALVRRHRGLQLRPRHPQGRGLRQPWRSTNGPIRLMQLMGRMPDLIPYTFSISIPINTTVAGTQIGRATMDAESDFYCVSTSVCLTGTGEEGLIIGGGALGLKNFAWWGKVNIQEGNSGIRLSNDAVSVGSIFGYGDRPCYWPVPWIIRAGREVKLTIRNESTLGNANHTAIFCFHGFKRLLSTPDLPIDVLMEPRLLDTFREYREFGKLGHVEPFFYSFLTGQTALSGAAGNFVAGATETVTITVADADFAGCYLAAEVFDSTGKVAEVATKVSGATSVNNYAHLCQLVVDEGNARLTDRPVPVTNLFGHGKRWMKLPKPLILKAGQTMSLILTPQIAAPPADGIWKGGFTLAGVRIFPDSRRA